MTTAPPPARECFEDRLLDAFLDHFEDLRGDCAVPAGTLPGSPWQGSGRAPRSWRPPLAPRWCGLPASRPAAWPAGMRLLARERHPGAATAARRRRHRRWLASGLASSVVVATVAVVLVAVLVAPGSPAVPRWALAGTVSVAWQETPASPLVGGSWLTCTGASTCYVAGAGSGQLVVTHDGGKTWGVPGLPDMSVTPLAPVACVGPSACSLLSANPDGTSFSFSETTGASRGWATSPAPKGVSLAYRLQQTCAANKQGGPCLYQGPVMMSCTAAASCVVVASSGQGPASRSGSARSREFVTKDSGRSWSEVALPPRFWAMQLQCFAGGACVATGSRGGTVAALYSTNGGASWASASMPAEQGLYSLLSCSGPSYCLAMAFEGAEGAALSGPLLVSQDGGRVWSKVSAQGLPAGKDVTSLSCPTSSECWVSAFSRKTRTGHAVVPTNTLLASTTDGGHTWHADQLPRSIEAVGAVSCPKSGTCFALGYSAGTGVSEGTSVSVLLAYKAQRRAE